MKIGFVSPFPFTDIVTGGQIFDNNFLNIIEKDTSHDVIRKSLHSPIAAKIPPLAPTVYLLNSFKDLESDIIVTNSAHYMRLMLLPPFLRRWKKKKIYTIHHHFMYRQFSGLKRRIYKYFEWKWLRSMDTIICASPYVYDELTTSLPDKNIEHFQTPFEIAPKLDSHPIPSSLTFTGTIEPRKGLIYLIKALAMLKNQGFEYPLTIVGKITDRNYYNNLLEIISANSLNVTFTGFISNDEVERILSSTDVFVFPSLLEGYGRSIIEAQVYGLPIVSFDNSAMPYNVKNGENGFTVPTGDFEKFAEAIRLIVENRELRNKFSEGAIKNIENQHTQETFRQEIIRYFSKF